MYLNTLKIVEIPSSISSKNETIDNMIKKHLSTHKNVSEIPIQNSNLKDDSLIHITKDKNCVYAYENFNKKLTLLWNNCLNEAKDIQLVKPDIHERENSALASNGKIFYKNLDTNLLGLIALTNDGNLTVSIINVLNGNILYTTTIKYVVADSKVLSIFEENIFIISYTKSLKSFERPEILVIELMKSEIEYSLISFFEKQFSKKSDNNDLFSQNDESIFMKKTFILPYRPIGIYASKSLFNVANKNFIFLFENNQIKLFEKRILSARRPTVRGNYLLNLRRKNSCK